MAQVAFRRDVLGYAPVLLIRYYAPVELPLQVWRLSLDSDDTCQGLIPSVRALFTAMGEPPVMLYATRRIPQVTFADIVVLRLPAASSAIRRAPKRYTAYPQCVQAIPEALAVFGKLKDFKPLGAVCGVGDNGIKMSVFGLLKRT